MTRSPPDVALALGISPTSSRCGASIAYGLTDGGINAKRYQAHFAGQETALVPRKWKGEDAIARREAILKPILREFLRSNVVRSFRTKLLLGTY